MPEIEITEDQYEYLKSLREEIQTEVVGKYAHVRTVDALQYLIDSHEGSVTATTAAGDDDATTSGGGFVVTGGDAGSGADANAPADLEEADGGESADGEEADDGTDEADGEEANDDAASDDASGGTGGPPMAAAGGDDGMLSAMMQLLETYDEKWAAVEGNTGYEVELPDGSSETANTRDDVRALLFKHYE